MSAVLATPRLRRLFAGVALVIAALLASAASALAQPGQDTGGTFQSPE